MRHYCRSVPPKKTPIISLVNLGCAKNLVDSERILGHLAEHGFLIAQDPSVADLCLVNTCGFIHDAREETAGVLSELAALKTCGQLKALVALGCLVERVTDAPELDRFLQAADARLGFKEYPRIAQICRELIERKTVDSARLSHHDASVLTANGLQSSVEISRHKKTREQLPQKYYDFQITPRLRIGSPHIAYLKISEGCNNRCRFCSIPRMRGRQVSQPIEKLVAETRELAASGAQEIILIAQDTTSYGRDLYGRFALVELLRALIKIKGPRWFRLMYAYPKFVTAELLDALASNERFCPYIDLPLQHIADTILADMGRGVTKSEMVSQLDLIAQKLPNSAIRTTFITGYPGENDKHVNELIAFVKEGRFAHVGVFLYSAEPLTLAAKTHDIVPLTEKQSRRAAIMLAQRDVSRRRLRTRVGRKIELLIDGALPKETDVILKGSSVVARTQLEAPEVDGVVYLTGRGVNKLLPGEFVAAKITRALDYDLIAIPCAGENPAF